MIITLQSDSLLSRKDYLPLKHCFWHCVDKSRLRRYGFENFCFLFKDPLHLPSIPGFLLIPTFMTLLSSVTDQHHSVYVPGKSWPSGCDLCHKHIILLSASENKPMLSPQTITPSSFTEETWTQSLSNSTIPSLIYSLVLDFHK